jgi:imidazolonepropionase-like amidohydrolase
LNNGPFASASDRSKLLRDNSCHSGYVLTMRLRLVFPLLWLLASFGALQSHASDLALVGAKIYLSPSEAPIESGTVFIHDRVIVSVGPMAQIKVPRGATVVDCRGLVVTAGFWNSHVHILLPGLLHAEKLSSAEITSQLQNMLTRWGFTTVFDIASVLQNTNVIRHRIERDEVRGPRIFTVGEPFWVETPIYIKGFLEANHISMPQVDSTGQATERVHQQIRDGADGIKIFANSIESNQILTMPLDLAQVIAAAAHRAGKPVFAHVSNRQGIEVAIQSGVDILAHTTPIDELWSSSLVERLTAAHMALTPTLTLWDVESKKANASEEKTEEWMSRAAQELGAFSRAGGQVLFGTDVGYIQHFDTSEEFTWMSHAGMTFPQILASLTTSPAQRFGYSTHSGRIAKGMDADLVVLSDDPAKNISAFSRVRYTIRGGEVIYAEK